MKKILNESQFLQNEEGYILVLSMLSLIILTILLISTLNSAFLGTQIAGNDKTKSEAAFAAKGCAQIKGREILAGNGGPLAWQTLGTGLNCQTNQPTISYYNDKLVGYKLGTPGGWAVQQMIGIATGQRSSTFIGRAQSDHQFMVQRVFKK